MRGINSTARTGKTFNINNIVSGLMMGKNQNGGKLLVLYCDIKKTLELLFQ
jgi:hypothetical protein